MAVRLNYDKTRLLRSLQNDLKTLSPKQSPEAVIGQFLTQVWSATLSGSGMPRLTQPVRSRVLSLPTSS